MYYYFQLGMKYIHTWLLVALRLYIYIYLYVLVNIRYKPILSVLAQDKQHVRDEHEQAFLQRINLSLCLFEYE